MTVHWLVLTAFASLMLVYRTYRFFSRGKPVSGERGVLLLLVGIVLLSASWGVEEFTAVPRVVGMGLLILAGIAFLGSFLVDR